MKQIAKKNLVSFYLDILHIRHPPHVCRIADHLEFFQTVVRNLLVPTGKWRQTFLDSILHCPEKVKSVLPFLYY